MSVPLAPVASAGPLLHAHDLLLIDLDGVVQLGDEAVPGAADAIAEARAGGVRISFVTNNAAREPAEVAARLSAHGIDASAGDVMTSAMAAADRLAQRFPAGAPVLVVGGRGLHAAVAAAGLTPVRTVDAAPVAVVQGWGPDICWADLAEAAVAIRAGAPWLATNLDRTLPSPRGPLPGNGALVEAVRTACGVEPESIGKPGPVLFRTAVARGHGQRPLVVGDRLDTDVAGAVAAGIPALLVLTGVSRPADVLAAPAALRPAYLGADLGAVRVAHPGVDDDGAVVTCRETALDARTGRLVHRPADADPVDGLRAACACAWSGRLPRERYAECLAGLGLQ